MSAPTSEAAQDGATRAGQQAVTGRTAGRAGTADPAHERGSRPGPIRRAQELATRGLEFGEAVILIGVAAILLVARLVVLFDASRDLLHAVVAQSMAEAVFSIAENALLVLILVELVRTLLVSLAGEALSAEPFLTVGIIAIVRKMLLVTVLAPKPTDYLQPPSLLESELFSLGIIILGLAVALALVRRRQPRPG
jgi:uncharacterized membrane protein (DUF373 family)